MSDMNVSKNSFWKSHISQGEYLKSWSDPGHQGPLAAAFLILPRIAFTISTLGALEFYLMHKASNNNPDYLAIQLIKEGIKPNEVRQIGNYTFKFLEKSASEKYFKPYNTHSISGIESYHIFYKGNKYSFIKGGKNRQIEKIANNYIPKTIEFEDIFQKFQNTSFTSLLEPGSQFDIKGKTFLVQHLYKVNKKSDSASIIQEKNGYTVTYHINNQTFIALIISQN